MGSGQAAGYAGGVAEGIFSLYSAVAGHLLTNFLPAHPRAMIAPAVRAIEKINRGDFTSRVRSPYAHRVHGKLVPVLVMVDTLKLEAFITNPEYWED